MRKHEKIIATSFICLLICFLLGYPLGYLNKKRTQNEYQSQINMLQKEGKVFDHEQSVNYAVRYPFEASETKTTTSSKLDSLKNMMHKYISKVDDLADNLLFKKNLWIDLYGKFNSLVGENVIYQEAIVYKQNDGYLNYLIDPLDTSENASRLNAFATYVDSLGMKFMYLQLPSKLSFSTQAYDYANLNADNLVNSLDFEYDDLRDRFRNDGYSYEDIFFKTDHHWNVEGAMKASEYIVSDLESLGLKCDEIKDYQKITLDKGFLGSEGKKMGLGMVEAEDFNYYILNDDSKFEVNSESANVKAIGTFEDVMFNYYPYVHQKDYYGNTNTYAMLGHGNPALISFVNLETTNDTQILLIRDSFSSAMLPYLATRVKQVDALDLRYFNGSVEAYLRENSYDAVIVAYNPSAIVAPTSTHNNFFNFE